MRLILLTIAAALASCGAPAERNQAGSAKQRGLGSGDQAINEAAPAAPGTQAPARAETATANMIPAAFHGVYDQDRESCGRPSEYRLTVTADALRFHESIGTVTGVIVTGRNDIEVVSDYEGEGESWANRRRLRLADGRLTISGEGIEMVRVRCP